MRIIIEIDENGVTSTRLADSEATMELPEPASEVPPPELFKAALKLGAESAGPAAITALTRRVVGTRSMIERLSSAPGDSDAGEAPGASTERARKAPAGKRNSGKKGLRKKGKSKPARKARR